MTYITVDVDVDLDDFDTDDLINELEGRGYSIVEDEFEDTEFKAFIRTIYEKRRIGNDYQSELDELFDKVLGKIL